MRYPVGLGEEGQEDIEDVGNGAALLNRSARLDNPSVSSQQSPPTAGWNWVKDKFVYGDNFHVCWIKQNPHIPYFLKCPGILTKLAIS